MVRAGYLTGSTLNLLILASPLGGGLSLAARTLR